MIKTVNEDYQTKQRQVEDLSRTYDIEPQKVWVIDMQRASVNLRDPPRELLPKDLKNKFQFATLVMESKGVKFTTSETSVSQSLFTPYDVISTKNEERFDLEYDNIPIPFEGLKLLEIFGSPPLYYFPLKYNKENRNGFAHLIVNPYEDCSKRCKPCARLPHFKERCGNEEENLSYIADGVFNLVGSSEDIKLVQISTGSTINAESDLKLYEKIISFFNNKGFSNCDYSVSSSNIEEKKHMLLLKEMGVTHFIPKVETTSLESTALFSTQKRPLSEVIDMLNIAEDIFPYISINIMLGYEDKEQLKQNLEKIAEETNITIKYCIPRIYSEDQLNILHPSAKNLEYFVELCKFIEKKFVIRKDYS